MTRSKESGVFIRLARTNSCRLDQILDQYIGSELPRSSATIPLLPRNYLNTLSIVNLTRQTKGKFAA
jgi:hypothetical protein